jgi:hypothetical protein
MKKSLLLGAATALLAVAGLAVSTVGAGAYVYCNAGDCWHSDARVTVPGITFDAHPDDWYFHQHWDADHHWHDYHDGHGYWKSGVWINL